MKNTIAEWLKTNTNPKICEEFLVKLESDPNCEVNIMKALENVHCEEFVGDVLVKS